LKLRATQEKIASRKVSAIAIRLLLRSSSFSCFSFSSIDPLAAAATNSFSSFFAPLIGLESFVASSLALGFVSFESFVFVVLLFVVVSSLGASFAFVVFVAVAFFVVVDSLEEAFSSEVDLVDFVVFVVVVLLALAFSPSSFVFEGPSSFLAVVVFFLPNPNLLMMLFLMFFVSSSIICLDGLPIFCNKCSHTGRGVVWRLRDILCLHRSSTYFFLSRKYFEKNKLKRWLHV
jgi:hypothetical protein